MSVFLKPMGYLTMFAASVSGSGYSAAASGQTTDAAAVTAQSKQSVQLPRPPLKIPMPLDKAGYKIEVTFEVASLPEGMTYLPNLIGLRVLFAPGTDEVADAIAAHPITVRISLHRIENGKAIRIPLFDSKLISRVGEYPQQYEVFELPDGKATARMLYADHSGAPRGTPNASAFVLGLTGAKKAVTPGIYQFQVETLEEIPELNSAVSFFVYEKPHKR